MSIQANYEAPFWQGRITVKGVTKYAFHVYVKQSAWLYRVFATDPTDAIFQVEGKQSKPVRKICAAPPLSQMDFC